MKRLFTARLALTLFLVLFTLSQYVVGAAQERPLVITHAVIVDGNGKTPIEDGTIVIQGSKIEAVGAAINVKVPSNARVIDAKGKTAMPGLADMHVHLTGGWDGESVDMLGYQRYLNALLYAGVTTVLDTGNVQPYILQLRQEVARGRLVGPRIYCAGALIDGADPAWPPISYSVSSLEQIPGLVRRQKQDAVDIIKAYGGLSDRMVAALAQEAKKNSLRVFIDQWSRNGSMDLMQEGISAFAHLPTMRMSDEAIRLMKEKGIHCITTLTVYESFSRRRLADLRFLEYPLFKETSPPWFLEELRKEAGRELKPEESSRARRAGEGLSEAQRNVKKLFDAGILVAAGTDAPYPGVLQGEGIHRELELLVEAGLSPLEAITVATKNAALLMNAADEWGTLAPGKVANIVLITGHPDKHISDTRNIETVIQAGRLLDREKLKFDARKDPGFRVASPVAAVP
ncbi:MAG TPA: amidohydrolase family protein [Pyrinomonadaceae bacterium]|jgi:imidazolonepropionase-like amidohydrolase